MSKQSKVLPVGGINSAGNIVIRFPKARYNKFSYRDISGASWYKEERILWNEECTVEDENLLREFNGGKYHITRSHKFRASEYATVRENVDDSGVKIYFGHSKSKSKLVPYSIKIII